MTPKQLNSLILQTLAQPATAVRPGFLTNDYPALPQLDCVLFITERLRRATNAGNLDLSNLNLTSIDLKWYHQLFENVGAETVYQSLSLNNNRLEHDALQRILDDSHGDLFDGVMFPETGCHFSLSGQGNGHIGDCQAWDWATGLEDKALTFNTGYTPDGIASIKVLDVNTADYSASGMSPDQFRVLLHRLTISYLDLGFVFRTGGVQPSGQRGQEDMQKLADNGWTFIA